jgi:hypothetical protein
MLIIIGSLALFGYWFRYTCLLLLSQRSSEGHSSGVAATIQLNFPNLQAALQTGPPTPALDRLHALLDHDYELLTGLLQHARGADSIERRFLTIDYRLMRVWYQMIRRYHRGYANKALTEMAGILQCFADEIGAAA